MNEREEMEWRQLILEEIRAARDEVATVREELHNFQLQVVEERGERRGRSSAIAAVVSTVVSIAVALIGKWAGFIK